MKIGILGTGVVGETLANALVNKGHLVRMGSRTSNKEKAMAWAQKANEYASYGDFSDAASFGDLIILCLNGEHALNGIRILDEEDVRGKIIIDVTNPLDFSRGLPPGIVKGLGNTTSLGEQIQEVLPGAYVVKALNTVNCKLMVDARIVNNGDHHLFICGNHIEAKNKVMHFLVDNFHWRADRIMDLGSIAAARTLEGIVPFWVLLYQSMGTPVFNFKIVQ